MGQLHVKFAEIRAAVAQQLHRIAQKSGHLLPPSAIAALGDGDLVSGLPRAAGGHASSRVFAPLGGVDLAPGLARVIGCLRPTRSPSSMSRTPAPSGGGAVRRKGKSPEERCVDS